jgi:hypothetical protein
MERRVVSEVPPPEEFPPIQLTINSKRDCYVAVSYMWKYSIPYIEIDGAFRLISEWASIQRGKEESMKVILEAMLRKYCPHYTYRIERCDEEYGKKLLEYKELSKVVDKIKGGNKPKMSIRERFIDDTMFGAESQRMTVEQYLDMRDEDDDED